MRHQTIQKGVALKLLHTFQGILLDMGRNQETTLACGTAARLSAEPRSPVAPAPQVRAGGKR